MTEERLCRMSIKYMGEDMFKCGSKVPCDYQYDFASERWCALYWSFHPPRDVSRIMDLATHVEYILDNPINNLDLPLAQRLKKLNERRKRE